MLEALTPIWRHDWRFLWCFTAPCPAEMSRLAQGPSCTGSEQSAWQAWNNAQNTTQVPAVNITHLPSTNQPGLQLRWSIRTRRWGAEPRFSPRLNWTQAKSRDSGWENYGFIAFSSVTNPCITTHSYVQTQTIYCLASCLSSSTLL